MSKPPVTHSSDVRTTARRAAVRLAIRLRLVSQWMVRSEQILAVVLLVGVLLTMGGQVVARYVFARPFSWSEELARFGLIWLTFLAAAYVSAQGGHVAVDLWSRRISRRWRVGLGAGLCLIVAGTCLLLFVGGLPFAYRVHPVSSPSLGIPKSLWYGAVSVGLLLITLHSLINMTLLLLTGRPLDPGPRLETEGLSALSDPDRERETAG